MSGDQVDAKVVTGFQPDARGFGFSLRSRSPTPPSSYEIERYGELEDRDFEYHMKHRSRGVALIINNEKFHRSTQMSDRTGSNVDRDNLFGVLKYVGFTDSNIWVRNNVTAKEMTDLMEQAAEENYRDKDCLFVAILSHGDDGNIYGVDTPVPIDRLFEPLKRSVSLVGKPKIFVIQACRGEQLDAGVMYESDAGPPKRGKQYFISRESDFLVAYSVVPGYYSWRNCSNGSWFIQAFCEVMRADGRRLEIMQILARVNRMVSYTFKSNAGNQAMTNKKQSPCITSMLTKALYFA